MFDDKITLNKIWLHFKTICIHKKWVFYYAVLCGIPVRGFFHDMSKFSPTEFWNNVRYTEPGISPIDVQKREMGYSYAWLHHKGRNPHHYEYWMDNFDKGTKVIRMPYKYAVEMLCDYLAANKAYNGKNATYAGEYEWWQKQREIKKMHPDNRKFLDCVFYALVECEKNGTSIKTILNKSFLDYAYYNASYPSEFILGNDVSVFVNDI